MRCAPTGRSCLKHEQIHCTLTEPYPTASTARSSNTSTKTTARYSKCFQGGAHFDTSGLRGAAMKERDADSKLLAPRMPRINMVYRPHVHMSGSLLVKSTSCLIKFKNAQPSRSSSAYSICEMLQEHVTRLQFSRRSMLWFTCGCFAALPGPRSKRRRKPRQGHKCEAFCIVRSIGLRQHHDI